VSVVEIGPYLTFDGQCAAAFRFYEHCLSGRIEMMQTSGESPMRDPVTAERDKVIHARLVVDGKALMGSDAPPGRCATPQGTHVSIGIPARADAERIFDALAEGGSVSLPFQRTFWSSGFGMLTDRFGTPWMLNCEQPA
jgi:PhnB protein